MIRNALLLVFLVIQPWGCSVPRENESTKTKRRPNILLIVADDLGYADLGVYGSDISTPNIDQLARNGLLFSRFHTGVMCAPTRSMLLSGNDNHIAGVGIQSGGNGIFQDKPGYEGYLSDRIVPLPLLMKDAGYHTYTVGKWHLGHEEENSPKAKGFERSYNLLNGAGNHYSDIGLFDDEPVSEYREDGNLVKYPEGQYSTDFYTGKLLQFIEEGMKDGNPFFAFTALTSPHWPLQAPEQFDNYKGRYDIGYDSLRRIRFESLKRAGIIPGEAKFPPHLESITPWTDLTDKQKKIEARKMELYAAMVENLDYNVGRIIQFLKEKDLYDNTMIIFMADNGAAGEDYYNDLDKDGDLYKYYDNSYENMGNPNSFISYGPPWAQAGAAPFNRYKTFPTEGGISAPMIMSGVNISGKNEIRHTYFTVMDLAPTFLEIAGINYPGTHGTDKTKPMMGESMLSYLIGEKDDVHNENYVTRHEHRLRFYVRKGDWKLVNIQRPLEEKNFQLYNLAKDLGETTDLKMEFPEVYNELLQEWRNYVRDAQIIIPDNINP